MVSHTRALGVSPGNPGSNAVQNAPMKAPGHHKSGAMSAKQYADSHMPPNMPPVMSARDMVDVHVPLQDGGIQSATGMINDACGQGFNDFGND